MGVNKVVYNGGTLIDISEDTVASNKMLEDVTAHDKTGEAVIGSIPIVAGGSFEPSTSERTVVSGGSYVQNDVKVGAIPSSYVKPSGTLSITENGTHDVTNYASVEVNVANSGGSPEEWILTLEDGSTVTKVVYVE